MSFKVPNQYRFRDKNNPYGSDDSIGNYEAFYIPFESVALRCLASEGEGWEHVSVSLSTRCPNWKEMCYIKSLFWDDEDTVIQYHPSKSEYINNHPYCLHLWRPINEKIPLPPNILVGIKKRWMRMKFRWYWFIHLFRNPHKCPCMCCRLWRSEHHISQSEDFYES